MIDFHCHTTASDGEYTPTEIVKFAKDLGVHTLAITDHDTIDGLEEAIIAGKNYGVEIIPGVELNVEVPKGQMHILGYYIDYDDEQFKEEMRLLREDRNNRNMKYIEEFNKIGINMSFEDIKRYAAGKVVGKPHFARYLLEHGYVSSIEEAFKKYINTPEFKKIKRKIIPVEHAIKIIKDAGGIVVLAHPVTLKLSDEELEFKIKELKKLGLDGVECYNSIHTLEDINKLSEIAFENDLLITAGSDFHGPVVKPNIHLGTGKNNNVKATPEMLENLKKHKTIKSIS